MTTPTNPLCPPEAAALIAAVRGAETRKDLFAAAFDAALWGFPIVEELAMSSLDAISVRSERTAHL